MATATTNYGWSKPSYEDDADIMVINDTIDDIDAQVKSNETKITVNRAELIELVDSGAKNIANANTLSSSYQGVECTQNPNDKNIITLSGTNTASLTINLWGSNTSALDKVLDEDYFIAGALISTNIVYNVYYRDVNDEAQFKVIGTEGLTIPAGSTLKYVYVQQQNANKSINFSVKLMCCTKAAWDISQEYQPFRPSYQELYERVVALEQANGITRNISITEEEAR